MHYYKQSSGILLYVYISKQYNRALTTMKESISETGL
jgi:hypothetical protein